MTDEKKERLLKKLQQVEPKEDDFKKLIRSTSAKLTALRERDKIWQGSILQRSKSDDLPTQTIETEIKKSEIEDSPEDDTKKPSFGNS